MSSQTDGRPERGNVSPGEVSGEQLSNGLSERIRFAFLVRCINFHALLTYLPRLLAS